MKTEDKKRLYNLRNMIPVTNDEYFSFLELERTAIKYMKEKTGLSVYSISVNDKSIRFWAGERKTPIKITPEEFFNLK